MATELLHPLFEALKIVREVIQRGIANLPRAYARRVIIVELL